jgi:hypothetical protein
VSLAALYHPLRLAEEVAPSTLTGGRINWGASRVRARVRAFGVPIDETSLRPRPSRSCWRRGRTSG